MTEKFRALEKLANDPRTPPHEAAAARRILERLKKEAAAGSSSASKHDAKPPPQEPRSQTAYFFAPGFGLLMVGPEQIPELKQMHPAGRVLTKAQADAWFAQEYGSRSTPRRPRTSSAPKKPSAPRASKKTGRRRSPRVVEVDRDLNPIGKKRSKKVSTKTRDGSRKPPPKTRTEKELGFVDKVLRRSNAVKVAVATGDKVVGTWVAEGEANIRATLKKALAQAHLLAKRGYETCIAVIHEDGGQTVQCWPE